MATGLLALGLVFIVEGLAWALAPSLVERMLEALRTLPEGARRQLGLLSAVAGLFLIWLARLIGG